MKIHFSTRTCFFAKQKQHGETREKGRKRGKRKKIKKERKREPLLRDDDVASVYEIRVSPGYLQFAPDADRTGRLLYGKRIEWWAFAIPVARGLRSIVTLCLLIR